MATQTAELARAPQHHRRSGTPRRLAILLAVVVTVLTVGVGTWKLGSSAEPAGGRAPAQSTTPVISEPPIAVAPPPDAPAAPKAAKAAKAGKRHTP
ncbi:MAG TPA: hypothetical protein VGJ14_07465 [Sporichthyaceae bacterium]|jgi:hypothetical protein